MSGDTSVFSSSDVEVSPEDKKVVENADTATANEEVSIGSTDSTAGETALEDVPAVKEEEPSSRYGMGNVYGTEGETIVSNNSIIKEETPTEVDNTILSTGEYTTKFTFGKVTTVSSSDGKSADTASEDGTKKNAVEVQTVDSNVKDPRIYEIHKGLYSTKDEMFKLKIDDVPYVSIDSSTNMDSMVIKSQYDRDYKPVRVKDIRDVQLGSPYKGGAYTTESVASQDGKNRSLGSPYSIRTRTMDQAVSQGY